MYSNLYTLLYKSLLSFICLLFPEQRYMLLSFYYDLYDLNSPTVYIQTLALTHAYVDVINHNWNMELHWKIIHICARCDFDNIPCPLDEDF